MSDKDIVTALKTNPEKGFRLLMDKYKEPLYWHIRRLVVDFDDAQDAAQETFIRIYRSINNYKEGSFAAWIYKIATNEALRMLGKKKDMILSLDLYESEANSIAASEYINYEDAVAVKFQKAILSLPPKQQAVFNLRYYDEMEYDEIAEVVSTSPESAKTNYHLAKKKIVDYMNSHD